MISPATIIKLEQSEEYFDESSQESTESSHLYEAFEHPMNEKTSTAHSDCGDQDSLYLNISRGRRYHLQLPRCFVLILGGQVKKYSHLYGHPIG